MNREVLVRVDHVRKKFCRDLRKSLWYGVRDICSEFNPFVRKTEFDGRVSNTDCLRDGEFWAVDDTSFEIRRGECLGLIGHNGAGKTTLLKMLSGLIKPDGGRIEIHGRVGALISLGAGFNPILTGRENIYVNATILGLKKREIDEKLDHIIDFADIGDFIDTPVQSYSSGMQVRLGFAIATAIEPEVLLLDEVLAVGDMSFRTKCYNRIGRLQKNAATVLVTHDMSYLATVCNRILFMSHGNGTYFSDRNAGIQRYIDAQTPTSNVDDSKPVLTFSPPLNSAAITVESERLQYGDDLAIVISMDCSSDLHDLQLRCTASTDQGHPVLGWDSDWTRQSIALKRGRQAIRLVFGPIHLTGGRYTLYLSLTAPGNGELLFYSHRNVGFEITSKEICQEFPTAFGLKTLDFQYDSVLTYLSQSTNFSPGITKQ
jgi:homopolymeric O-antigen transport system ATP-binding protein